MGGALQSESKKTIIDCVGEVIEFWGFKSNHGRIWAFLYIEGDAKTRREIREALGLSKGAVSMLTNELLRWKVIRRPPVSSGRATEFEAERDFLKMVRNVLREREFSFVITISEHIEEAAQRSDEEIEDPEIVERIERISDLAIAVRQAMQNFIETGTFRINDAHRILDSATN